MLMRVATHACHHDRGLEILDLRKVVSPTRALVDKAHLVCFVDCNSHIFDKVFDKEAGSKFLSMMRGPRFASDQLPAAPEPTDSMTVGRSKPVCTHRVMLHRRQSCLWRSVFGLPFSYVAQRRLLPGEQLSYPSHPTLVVGHRRSLYRHRS